MYLFININKNIQILMRGFMKALVVTFIILLSANSFASSFYGRFWRGEEKTNYPELRNYCDDRTSDCFVELINRWLIPATPSYASQKALRAYAPVLLPKNLKSKYHDEIALILYSSEANYRALRNDKSNIEGSTYGPIHQDIFAMGQEGNKASSRSLVPKVFTKSIKLEGNLKEVSYDIKGTQADLIGAQSDFVLVDRSYLTVYEFKKNIRKYMRSVKRNKKIIGSFILITKDYFMQYNFASEINDLHGLVSLRKKLSLKDKWIAKLTSIKPIQSNPLLYERITYGEGANVSFNPGEKIGKVDHYRLHTNQNE